MSKSSSLVLAGLASSLLVLGCTKPDDPAKAGDANAAKTGDSGWRLARQRIAGVLPRWLAAWVEPGPEGHSHDTYDTPFYRRLRGWIGYRGEEGVPARPEPTPQHASGGCSNMRPEGYTRPDSPASRGAS